MITDTAPGSILEGGSLTASLVIALFPVRMLARPVGVMRRFLRRRRQGGAVLDFVLLPAAVHAAGSLVASTLGDFALGEWQSVVEAPSHPGAFPAFGHGAAGIVATRIDKPADGRQRPMSRLARTILSGGCTFVGVLLFLVTCDEPPAKLQGPTGAVPAGPRRVCERAWSLLRRAGPGSTARAPGCPSAFPGCASGTSAAGRGAALAVDPQWDIITGRRASIRMSRVTPPSRSSVNLLCS